MKKILMIALIVIGALIALPLIAALFVSNEYAVEREVVIRKPKQEVFNYIKILKNQDTYNKWVMMDPGMDKAYKGNDGTVGFVYAWDGSKAGKGEQEIKTINEGERMDMELRFKKPFESTAYAYFATKAISTEETSVMWGMKGRSKYPMNLMNLFMNSMLGKDIQEGLQNLKSELEK